MVIVTTQVYVSVSQINVTVEMHSHIFIIFVSISVSENFLHLVSGTADVYVLFAFFQIHNVCIFFCDNSRIIA